MEFLRKILFVDDHKLIRTLTANYLKSSLGAEVVQAKNGQDGLAKFNESPFSFDMVVTDVYMPVMDGLEMAEKIRDVNSQIKFVVFSMMGDLKTIKRMIKIGIQGYVLKEGNNENLLNGIEAVKNGEYYYSKTVLETLLSLSTTEPKPNFSSDLTRNEKEVAELCFFGLSMIEISQILGIPHGEVARRKDQLLDKVDIKDLSLLREFG